MKRFAYILLAILILAIMPTPVNADPLPPRHLTFELWQTDYDTVYDRVPIDVVVTCQSANRPAPHTWELVTAPVVNLNGIWYVSILSSHDTMLWCQGEGITYAPMLIEDHDQGLPGSGDRLVLIMDRVQTIEIGRDKMGLWEPLGVEACGSVSGSGDAFCTELPIASEVFGYGDGGPRTWWGTNMPGWVERWGVTSWRYNGPVR